MCPVRSSGHIPVFRSEFRAADFPEPWRGGEIEEQNEKKLKLNGREPCVELVSCGFREVSDSQSSPVQYAVAVVVVGNPHLESLAHVYAAPFIARERSSMSCSVN